MKMIPVQVCSMWQAITYLRAKNNGLGGNGDFGRAWDRNLTDEDGPYIELMAGVYTENQPDFSWLQPYEEKSFVQYFLPYRELGVVKNASKDLLMNIEPEGEESVRFKVFATSCQTVKCGVAGEKSGKSVFQQKKLPLRRKNCWMKWLM